MNETPTLKESFNGEWTISYPSIVEQLSEGYWQAIELMDSQPKKAERLLKKIISACGSAHIDALLHLGFLYNDSNKPLEGSALIAKAHLIALQSIPKEFNPETDKIEWFRLENRPFLRTYYAFGLECMKERLFQDAIDKFAFVLNVNPRDNQGVRFMLPECLVQLGKYTECITLVTESEDRDSIEFIFPLVLSYYKIERYVDGKSAYLHAAEKHPFVAEELLRDEHEFPHDEFATCPVQPSGIPVGSKQEAFAYWRRTRDLWDREKGFKEFLMASI